jgi:phosphoribosyl-ATP pyrophosphohydrolase
MSHEKYALIGTPEDKVIEECAELIQAVMKARRFGYFNCHPDDVHATTNLDLIKMEMDDVVQKFNEYEKYLMEISHGHYCK